MTDVIALGCSAERLGRSQSFLKSDCTTDATSKGGVKLCFDWDAVTSMVGCTCFCIRMDFWYIVVMPKSLAASPIMGCTQICI